MAPRNVPLKDIPVPLTSELLRRLSHMVAGAPQKEDYYLVVSYNGRDHDIVPTTRGVPWRVSKRAAERQARAMRSEPDPRKGLVTVQALGPFRSTRRRGDKYAVKVSGVNTNVGGPWLVESEVDMICWSPSAFDKFIAPYYYQLYGAGAKASKKVEQLRRRMIQSKSGIMSHRWPTSPGIVFQPISHKVKKKEVL